MKTTMFTLDVQAAIESYQPDDEPKQVMITTGRPTYATHGITATLRWHGVPRKFRELVYRGILSGEAAVQLSRAREVNAALWALARKSGVADELRRRLEPGIREPSAPVERAQ